MTSPYLSGILAFLVCAGLLPAVMRLARQFNLYDFTGPLKIHQIPIPRLGGIAMAMGFLASAVVFLPLTSWQISLPLAIFMAIWVVSLIDDVTSLPSYLRLAVHLGAGAALWFGGWRLDSFRPPLVDLAATCLFVALVINAMNLLDGMDGLAAGTGAVISLGFIAIATGGSDAVEIAISSSLLGVCAGVLTANAPPATIFMGDSGSTLIGIALAFLSLNWIRIEPASHTPVVALIFLSIPLGDVALAIVRRARSHTALFAGDRSHYYDILLRRGWTACRVLEVSLGAECMVVFTGWLSARQGLSAELAAGITLAGLAGAAYFLGSYKIESKNTQGSHQGTSLGSALD